MTQYVFEFSDGAVYVPRNTPGVRDGALNKEAMDLMKHIAPDKGQLRFVKLAVDTVDTSDGLRRIITMSPQGSGSELRLVLPNDAPATSLRTLASILWRHVPGHTEDSLLEDMQADQGAGLRG